jgi:hypothetical protein
LLNNANQEEDEEEKNYYTQEAQSMEERYDVLLEKTKYEVCIN